MVLQILYHLNLFLDQRTRHLNKVLIKCRSSTAKIEVLPQGGKHYNNILLFDKCVSERVSLEVVLRYGSRMPSFYLEQAKETELCGIDFEVIFILQGIFSKFEYIYPLNLRKALILVF